MPPGETERSRRSYAWWWFAALYVALTALYARPLLSVFGTALPHDAGDPALNAWIVWWNAHAVPLTTAWWNAPIFFPMTGAFALSETLLAMTPLTTPLQWVGAGPVATYNVALLISYPAAALAAHALAYRLTGRHDASLLAGLAFGFSPYRAAQLPHIQLLWSFWMPVCLVALHRYLASRRTRDLVLAGVCWTFNGLSCGYYLVFFAVLTGLWMLWFVRARREWIQIGLTLVVASLPLMPVLVGYQKYLGAIGASRTRGEIEGLSADLSAIWAVSPDVWLPSHWTFAPNAEGGLYPGIAILLLAIAGLVAAWRRSPRPWYPEAKKGMLVTGLVALFLGFVVWLTGGITGHVFGLPVSVTRPHRVVGVGIWLVVLSVVRDPRLRDGWRRRSTFLFYILAAVAMFAFALGPVGRVFDTRFMDKAPYFWLMQLPGGESLRVPARFSMLFILCLSQAAALAYSRLTHRGSHRVLTAVLALLVVADGWVPAFKIAPVNVDVELAGIDPTAVVIELPMRDLYQDTAAMLRATTHRHAIANGFSGYAPRQYGPLRVGLWDFDPGVFDALRQFAPLTVVVNRAYDEDGKYVAFIRGLRDVKFERDTTIGPAYSLARQIAPSVPAGVPLSIVGVEASDNGVRAAAMIDADLDTRWEAEKPQAPGSEVRFTLERAAPLSRIEMDLAGWEPAYPRRLQISVASGDEPPQLVWEGGTAGQAFLGAYRDWRRLTVSLDLPAGTTARRVVMTLMGTDPDANWSIAELRAFGPAVPSQPPR